MSEEEVHHDSAQAFVEGIKQSWADLDEAIQAENEKGKAPEPSRVRITSRYRDEPMGKGPVDAT